MAPFVERRRRSGASRQIWRHLRAAMRLLIGHPIPNVSSIARLEDGRIVLVRRVDTGQWALPGGMIDWGETAEAATRRELREETGLDLVSVRRLVGVYSSPERDPRAHSICIALAVEARGEMTIHDPLELSEIRAFAESELPLGELAHDHDQQLRDYLAGRTVLR